MSDKTYIEAAQLAIKREECIIKLAIVLPSVDEAERVYAEAYDRWLDNPPHTHTTQQAGAYQQAPVLLVCPDHRL